MADVEVRPEAVKDTGHHVGAVADFLTTRVADAVFPPAQDGVSCPWTAALTELSAAIDAHSAAARAVATTLGQMLVDAGSSYSAQETANRTGLTVGSAAPAAVPAVPAPMVPPPSLPTTVPAPVLGPSPPNGKAIAEVFDAAAGPGDLYRQGTLLRQQAGELSITGEQLLAAASRLEQEWPSATGRAAAGWVRDLGSWSYHHADRAAAAAAAFDEHGDAFSRAQAGMPKVAEYVENEQRLTQAQAVSRVSPQMAVLTRPVITALLIEKAGLDTRATNGALIDRHKCGNLARSRGSSHHRRGSAPDAHRRSRPPGEPQYPLA